MIEVLDESALEEILALEAQGFPPTERWSAESWLSEFSHGNYVLGYREKDLLAVASFGRPEGVVDLRTVTVARNHRRQGIAKTLIRAGARWAAQQGAMRMMLEVSQVNDGAIALYSRLGFDGLAIRENYYGDGNDALVMELALADGVGV
ncbi:MAG: GNAT family N-acetyltransferase [Propionibacteriaceae bacterium]|jgi:ribosomal-protein-alanine N-acetyltransferase|nr:GNAT family N-acetyltransferase [Propionibacteriaceae bacterium]